MLSNSIYGRLMMNLLNYCINTKVCVNVESLIKSFSKPTFKKADFISDLRVFVSYVKPTVKVDSPIYVGFSILEHAKLMMYEFWYGNLVNVYDDRVHMGYTDTDSFVLNLETNDLSKEIKGPLAEHLDLSNFPTNHPLYNDRNKGKLGKLKIETGAEFITEFVALKPKVYSYTTTKSRVSHNILKGVSRQKKNKLNIQDYKDCLYRHKLTRTQMNNLRFKNRNMSVVRIDKLALSPFEDKRYYVCKNESYGYGHPETFFNGDSDGDYDDDVMEGSDGTDAEDTDVNDDDDDDVQLLSLYNSNKSKEDKL